ncbi:DUF4123 domain-containing protein [Variovorax paradoxus]|uniref:DUF4123 domain-containing protein n=1 Tax=Variovorax paradoxus (strain EPS) TaxID=595537 RepID=E6VA89_VARPE|nr:DUF4123 domain-containing protein [Variovorax paradoxus]ADU38561.1 hypothetical protein Varpa_4393 [Variovorax paradoxus EPS]
MRLPDWPWDDVPAALVESLSAQLMSRFAPGRPIYLLIDPFLGDEKGLDDHRAKYPIDGKSFDVPPDRSPYLIELEDRHDPLLDASLAIAVREHLVACTVGSGAFRIGAWLQTDHSSGALLARQLSHLFRARGAPNAKRYLRLADRRMLALLHQMPHLENQSPMPAIDWPEVLKGVTEWIYLDMNFKLQSLQGAPGELRILPLNLKERHWALPLQAEAINRTLMAWQQQRYPLPADATVQVLRKVANAQRRGIVDPQDQAAYSAEALCHEAFESWQGLDDQLISLRRFGGRVQDMLAEQRANWVDRSI